jgi:hypothetical protein
VTEAGNELIAKSRLTGFATMAGLRIFDAPDVLNAIPAIEAEARLEAVAAERQRIAAAVEWLTLADATDDTKPTIYWDGWLAGITAVLAIVNGETP